jgi:XTP/dITP diphosphohydrolase
MKVLIATSNPGKYRELREGLEPLGWTLFSLLDFSFKMPPENGATLEDNAILKAAYASKKSGLVALADDSGLMVEVLGGEPGVYSARYGGKETDTERNVYLLERLRHTPFEERRAKFKAVLALAHPDGYMELFEGETKGTILEAPRGDWGFGYDPLFWVPAASKTFAEMQVGEKYHYSHRGKALTALVKTYMSGNRREEPLTE